MAHIKVRLRGEQIFETTLKEGKVYLAGRKEDCDFLLPADTGISREHFQISFENGTWSLSVVSKFGFIIYAGKKVQTLELKESALFAVPPYEFEFDSSPPMTNVAKKNEIALRSSESAPSHINNFDDEKTHIGQLELVPILKMLDTNQLHIGNVRLDQGNFFLAGREVTCQIHIQDQRVSRKQFEIHRSGTEFTIIDPGSVNGTSLNGKALPAHTPQTLKSGDVIDVLGNTMIFELHDQHFQQMVDQVKSLSVINEPQWLGNPLPQTYDPMMYAPQASEDKKFDLKNFNFKEFDFKKNKARVALSVVAFVIIIAAIFSGGENQDSAKNAAATNASDPLAKLTPDQKSMMRHHYQLVENYLAQQKWSLAKGEIEKIKEILPDTYQQYERTKDLENNAEQGLLNEQEIEKLEAQQVEQKLQQEKITAQVELCRKKVNPNVSKEEVESCLQPALELNPEDSQIKQLISMVDQIITERLMVAENKKENDRLAAQLRAMYQKAEREEGKEDFINAIAAYQAVAKSGLPDRDSLKSKAQRQISILKSIMSSQTVRYIAEADRNVQEQQYKNAILSLRKAQKIDPNNSELNEKVENYMRELRKQMLIIFQEGILEENFGNIEGSEGKPGAKDKWKKVLDLDVPDGEYYQKSKQRLKKYGVM